MEPIVEIWPDRRELIERAQEVVIDRIDRAIRHSGHCTIALAGGSTPQPLYEALATADLDWSKLFVLWGDERYVPPTDPASNQRMARLAWLDRIPIPAANCCPIPTDSNDPAVDAAHYEQALRSLFQSLGTGDGAASNSEFPAIDLVLLGLGDDGHTASLFPQTAALEVRDRWVTVGNRGDEPRLTLTVPLLNQARCAMFLVAGESKQPAIAQVFAPCDDPTLGAMLDRTYPARLIRPVEGELWWLFDQAAGERLEF
ncbi:MAG: 6-phosphogluconolactonase [Oscillatoriales cyanobacterium]|nr:MAG: 6-phosphogluconolactonase [Oscillatoriales cyanobacterium]